MILSDRWISKNMDTMIKRGVKGSVRYLDRETKQPLANCFQTGEEIPTNPLRVISYGVSSFGYDVRITDDINQVRIFDSRDSDSIDPKNIKDYDFYRPGYTVDEEGSRYVEIPPGCYLQAPTIEYFKIPRDVMVIVTGKSTYARSGLICNVTPIEPEFEGEVVIELANCANAPVRCYLGEGVAQFLFFQGNEPCEISYRDKGGKYQGQTGITYAKV